ncbi:heme utilization cystosolic carrier protein HutX [Geovibrio thiophilus]|uniref:Heme utilization cystosolic carrier protein HutX n=1 Tax=Geovibrio thiophilus TaxID=139438 RepID=A0A410JZ31_9BACT|nr:heme utilization cystosolic carrier protein HutX [Geovibrio thiophilus]QAR33424.1 heme utilization cystosolic carrier protein HutX [Geovibrio thiophilus]
MQTEKITDYLSKNKNVPTLFAARELGVSERDILRNIEDDGITEVSGNFFDQIMKEITGWGAVTVIVTNDSAIIEMKTSVPAGQYARGFFNLHSDESPLGGHISFEEIESAFFVSRPFMGKESHSVQFFDKNGKCSFKIYLGRDACGKVLECQKADFIKLKRRCMA